MKFLVTGGAGFIGHNVVRELERQGHEVCVLDNFTNYGIIPDAELTVLHQQRLDRIQTQSIHNADIRNYNYVVNVFEECRPDVVIHCAAYPRAKAVDLNPTEGSQVLTQGLINLLRASEITQVRRFVYISSSMVYGNFAPMAYEDMICRPQGIYGILKLAGETLTRDLCRTAGIDHVVVRPSAVYGPHDVFDRVVSRFLYSAIRNEELTVCGSQERLDFTYIDDVVDGIVRAAVNFNSSRRTYNITRGSARSLLEAAELAIAIAGGGRIKIADANPRFPSRGTLSNLRAGEDFGYRGTIDIETGFRKYHEWITDTLLRH
jgi:nucleoside-diphosphate-sugar epimerase